MDKKPKNSFQYFQLDNKNRSKTENSKIWKSLDTENKEYYKKIAAKAKEEYNNKYGITKNEKGKYVKPLHGSYNPLDNTKIYSQKSRRYISIYGKAGKEIINNLEQIYDIDEDIDSYSSESENSNYDLLEIQ